jgi:hypothetical protein
MEDGRSAWEQPALQQCSNKSADTLQARVPASACTRCRRRPLEVAQRPATVDSWRSRNGLLRLKAGAQEQCRQTHAGCNGRSHPLQTQAVRATVLLPLYPYPPSPATVFAASLGQHLPSPIPLSPYPPPPHIPQSGRTSARRCRGRARRRSDTGGGQRGASQPP